MLRPRPLELTSTPADASLAITDESASFERQVLPDDRMPSTPCEVELARAREEIARLQSALSAATRPLIVSENSTFAEYLGFKTSFSSTVDKETLRSMAAFFEQCPVRVTPEEGDWILARWQADDWRQFPGCDDPILGGVEGVVLYFLGPQRVLADTGPGPWLEHDFTDEEWLHVFGLEKPQDPVDH